MLGGALLLAGAVAAACSDSVPEGADGGSPGRAGTGGATDGEGGDRGLAGHGHAGEGGSAGAPLDCDCGDDPNFIHVPLECACAAGLCTTLTEDLQTFGKYLGWPYMVLRGTCAAGYQVLANREACENGRRQTYDADGKLVYSSYGPYGGAPDVCSPRVDSAFSDFGIGAEDPAKDCQFCVLAHDGDGGAGGVSPGGSCYSDWAKYEPCEP